MNSNEIGLADVHGQDTNDLGVLIEKMQSTNYHRKNAIEILIKYGDLRAVEPLIKLLKNKNTKIRIATVKILIELQDVRAIEPLIKELGIEDLEVSKAAVKALEEYDGKSVDYDQMSVKELKAEMKGCKFWSIHGLKTSGGKAELIARLNEELRYQHQAYFKNIRAIEGVLPRSRSRYGKQTLPGGNYQRDDRIYLNWISFRVQEIFGIQSCDPDSDHPMEDKPIGHGPRPVFFFYEFNNTINSLSKIDDVQVVRILMRLFYNIELYDQESRLWEIHPFVTAFEPVIDAATEVLKNITDARAIRLFEEAKNGEERLNKVATEILKKTKFVETPISQFYEKIILISLPYLQRGKRIEWGVPAIAPLIKALEDEKVHALEALVELTKELIQTEEKENILKFLESDKPDIIRMGASLLKGVAEK